MKTRLRFAAWLLVGAQASALVAYGQVSSAASKMKPSYVKASNTGTRKIQRRITLKLFFTNPNHPDFATTCAAGEFVNRTIPATKRLADAALRQLFVGPTAEEKAKGMVSIERLSRYYIGVTIKRGVAIVNFRPGAETYLNGTACEQEELHTPIVKTLMQFSAIKSIEFAINGKIIEEWDA
jgi:spore germination protein GerM